MQDVISTPPRADAGRLSIFASRVRSEAPSLTECGATIISAVLLILSFPDFNFWPLAWVGLVPLFLAIAHKPNPWRAFFLGWLFGSVFFYGSCYWLTYSMIHFGGIPPVLAFVILLPGAIVMGVFPAIFVTVLARALRTWGATALFLAPLLWPALEWVRLEVTGQLWNALGYSQAYHPMVIQVARWGGVYAVGFLIVFVNAALAFLILRRSSRALGMSVLAILLVGAALIASNQSGRLGELIPLEDADAIVIAVQPNVPMNLVKTNDEIERFTARHFEMSEAALRQLPENVKPRLVIWPESPMNFVYGTDNRLRERLSTFAKANNTSVLLNSQEVAPNDGIYNSALLINQEGGLVVRYDKIRLLPFGEYVPLPQWLPGAGLIRAIVGDFTAGTNYQLMPVENLRAGVFICIESAYPSIARRFTREGADVLINISNDGYLGPTAVMRQHLANAVFRAVENDRQLLRVTNTGITAFITPSGEVKDATAGFRQEVRTWGITRAQNEQTFYATHGDLFAIGCVLFGLSIFVLSFKTKSPERR